MRYTRDAVIDTVKKGFPLNVMYWVKNKQGTFEMLDGQQRTISICQYVNKDYSIDYQYFHNLTQAEQEQILDYKLMIYICEGTDKEVLDWFRVIKPKRGRCFIPQCKEMWADPVDLPAAPDHGLRAE